MTLHFLKSNGDVPLLKTYYTKIYNKAAIYINELVLPPFSPFDFKGGCKKSSET